CIALNPIQALRELNANGCLALPGTRLSHRALRRQYNHSTMVPKSLKRYAWLSVAAALSTILLKGLAWRLTDSVGLLSDAIESFVNLAGALMALGMLSVADRPADDGHPYGHTKAEYFSSAFEGFLIIGAAVWIAVEAVARLRDARPVQA